MSLRLVALLWIGDDLRWIDRRDEPCVVVRRCTQHGALHLYASLRAPHWRLAAYLQSRLARVIAESGLDFTNQRLRA